MVITIFIVAYSVWTIKGKYGKSGLERQKGGRVGQDRQKGGSIGKDRHKGGRISRRAGWFGSVEGGRAG